VVRLTAAAAYIEEVALRLDQGEQDLEVEGSIAKHFATEAGNAAAEDAMQALGGYGYITEYEVEKIKRDVRITTVYEGTSEIQQNIISTFRWKKTRKTKGAFYESLANEMDRLATEADDVGCRHIALSARALNKTITFVNDRRLTRQQTLMFAVADMAMYVEVAASLARLALRLTDNGDSKAGRTRVYSRIFSNETADLVSRDILKIVCGSGACDPEEASTFLTDVSHAKLAESFRDLVPDMDRAADAIFGR
jgi:alkylation response protein AidB-like acyl-CoA dehydrogenase